MKRTFALALVLVMALTLIPVLSVNAAETVVYLKEGASGNGSSADNAVGTFDAAYSAIGAENDGIIVVVGSFNFPTDANWAEPAHAGKITFTGNYNGTDHAGEIVNPGSKHWVLNGPVTFDDIALNLTGTMVMRAVNNPIEFTENYTTTGTQKLYLVGGNQGASEEHKLDSDIYITIKGGTFLEVSTFARSGTSGDYTGTAHVYIGGNAVIGKFSTGNRSIQTNNCGSLDLTLDGGVITCWVAYGDSKAYYHTGNVSIYVTKNFNIETSFNDGGTRIVTDSNGNGIFYGINGASAFFNDANGYTFADSMGAQKYILKADAEIYDALLASDKLNKDSFTDFEKIGGTGETTTATTTATTTSTSTTAPSQTTGAETTAPTTGGNPQTGDVGVVFTAAALLAIAACIILLKKKSRT